VSSLYRFEPANKSGWREQLCEGGRLKAARVKAIVVSCSASVAEANQRGFAAPFVGDEYEIEWVEVADPDAAPATLDVLGTPVGASGPFGQAWAAGCARMQRGEGIWHHAGKVYVSTPPRAVRAACGNSRSPPSAFKALYVSHDQRGGNHVDNITVSPRGGLICCEDGGGSDDGSLGSGNRLVGLTAGGCTLPVCEEQPRFQRRAIRGGRQPLGTAPATGAAPSSAVPASTDGALSLRQHPDPRHHLRHHRAVGEGQPVGVAAQ